MRPPSFSIGIEEEYQTIDPETRDLRFISLRSLRRSLGWPLTHNQTAKTPAARVGLPVLIVFLAVAASGQPPSSPAETKPPDLNFLLQSIEGVALQNPAQARAYQVTREYKVFRGDDKQPTSEITTQINFVPPDTKTYKITQASGSKRGEKIVRQILDRETES